MFVYPRIRPCTCLLGPTPFPQFATRLYTHVYIRLSVFLGLTPFLQVFCICTPTCAFLYLFFGSNSLLAGVLHLYTHVCISILVFLGLTPFLQVFCVCAPTCTSLCLLFGSKSLLADIVASHA